MTVIYDMVKGSIQSGERQEAPATGHSETLGVTDLPTTRLEVRTIEAVINPADCSILHIRNLLRRN
jgi:hypothetical protein